MSYYDDFLKALKKKGLTIEDVADQSSGGKTESSGKNTATTGKSKFEQEFEAALNKSGLTLKDVMQEDEEDFLAPTTKSVVTQKLKEKKGIAEDGNDSLLDFFQKGALDDIDLGKRFEDGYQAFDGLKTAGDIGLNVGKAILGTVGDMGLNAFKGVAGIGEGLGKAVTYGVAGVADLIGQDDYADDVRWRAQENVTERLTKKADNYLDQYSLLGRTSDAIMQGVGQVGAIMATGGLGSMAGLGAAGTTALTTGTMGLSSFGSGVSEAYQNDATDEEALTYGLIAGASDAVTELIFGGMGKMLNAKGLSSGLSSADDVLAKKVSGLFKNQIAKNFAEFGVKASAEGMEEVMAGMAQAWGKWKTYNSEEDFWDIVKDENLLEQFVVGMATSGMMQSGIIPGTESGSLKEANTTGRDFITGLSQNEQAVIDKETEKRIAEQEASGKKLTNKEKSDIAEKVKKDMEKGYISTDTIEEALGGETYKTYKHTVDSEDALQREFDTLNKMKQGEMTGEQIDKRTELKEKLEYLKKNSKRSELKTKLDEEIKGLIQNDRLTESYNEIERHKQRIELDLNQYKNPNARKTAENLAKVLDNSNKARDVLDLMTKVSEDIGVTFTPEDAQSFEGTAVAIKRVKEFAADGKTTEYDIGSTNLSTGFKPIVTVDGQVVDNYSVDYKTGKITFETAPTGNISVEFRKDAKVNGKLADGSISINMKSKKYLESIVGHEVTHKLENTEFYAKLQEYVFEYAKKKGEYDTRYKEFADLYNGIEGTSVEAELTADLVGDYLFQDSDFINKLSTENRNVFQKLYDEIKHLLTLATAGSEQARRLEQVKHKFEQAYREAGKAQKNTADSGAAYALESKKQPGRLDPRTVTKADVEDMLHKVEEGSISGNTYIPVRIGTPEKLIYWAEKRRGDVIDNNPIAISADKAYNAMNRAGEMESGRPNKLSTDEIVAMIEGMNDPQYIVYQGANDRYVEVVKFDTKTGDKAFAVIEIGNNKDAVYMNGYEGGLYNILVTTYPPQSGKLKELLTGSSNQVIYDKNKDASQRTSSSTAPSVLNDASFYDDSLPDNGKEVKEQFSLSEAVEETNDLIALHKFSLSDATATPKRYGDRATLGEEVLYKPTEDIAPVPKTTAEATPTVPQVNVEDLFPDDTAPIQKEYAFLKAEEEDIAGAIAAFAAAGDMENAEKLWSEYQAVQEKIAAIEGDEADRLNSIEDADAPPETMENDPEDVADDVPLTKTLVTELAKTVRAQLGLPAKRVAEVRDLIARYSKEEFPSKAHLYTEIAEKFGTYTETQVDEDLKGVKALLRTYGIQVSDSIKNDIADYGKLMRSNFGKVRFSNEGLPVDVAYREFQEVLPGYFPESIYVPTDQLMRIIEVANMDTTIEQTHEIDWQTLEEVTDTIMNGVAEFKQNRKEALANAHGKESFQSLMEDADRYVPPLDLQKRPPTRAEMNASPDDIAPTFDTGSGQQAMWENGQSDDITKRLERSKKALREEYLRKRAELEVSIRDKGAFISRRASELYQELRGLRKGVKASDSLGYLLDHGYEWSSVRAALVNIQHTPDRTVNVNSAIENIAREMLDSDYQDRLYDISDLEAEYNKNVAQLEADAEKERAGGKPITRKVLHENIMDNIKTTFREKGFEFDDVLKNAKDLSTFATVDNTPQRVMEKALGYKQGQALSDLTVNKVAQNETEGIRWLNSFTDKKMGLLAKISKQYNIKPGSKASAAAQMYAEGFYVGENDAIIQYGDRELAMDFPDAKVQENIKKLARDPRIRQIYDETLAAINESRTRNAYPEIPRLDNYFLHFRAMEDTFSRLGLPFNPNDIRAKDLPTDLNGVTADLKPGQPYFASAKHREGKRTSFDLLGGLEKYLTSAKNQIYHIDDIQTLRALRNYVAETYGQATGLQDLDLLSDEEAEQKIKDVYGSHLSTFAKFLNEEANVLAGKTALIDRGLEGVIGRRGITFLDTLNRQVGANMVGFNVSSALTNFLAPVQAFAKSNKFDFVKAMAQTASNKIGSIFGNGDTFAEESPVMIRRKGAERFYRTPYEKVADAGYVLMGMVDDLSTELVARTKYNELTRKGMDSQQAHIETDKWVSRLMGDRSIGQQPQLYNSKMLGIVTKFQLEVRNQLDSQFYDTIQEAKVSTEDIQNGLERNAKKAAKITSTFVQLAVMQHLFGKAFESVAGYNPAFDIIEAIVKALGWDDEEDEEDTVLDNLEEAFLSLLGDLPYTSTLTGGRIPIASALPITEFIKGEDQYGNEKSRWDTIKEAAPYYLLPGGYGQIKKTKQGLGMFDEDLPIAGSYTDSGNLRFPVEDTLKNRVQAGLFGQWASANARDYFDNERKPLKENQIQELIDVDIPIREYWDYREELSKYDTVKEKIQFIESLDLPVSKKNILVNNAADRKTPIDLTDYDKYADFEEFDFASKNPEKYSFLKENNISYADYAGDEDAKEFYDGVYSWVNNYPDKVTVSKAVTSSVVEYRKLTKALDSISADKDAGGKTISGSAKEKKIAYINSLDIDYGAKLILFKNEYNADDTYNYAIVEYLNGRDDISFHEMNTILKELGFNVTPDGYITW